MSRFFLFLSYNLETSMSIWNYSCFQSKNDDDDDDTMMRSWWRRQCWIWLWWWLSNRLRQLRKENVITPRNFRASFCTYVIFKSFRWAYSARTLGKCTFDCVISLGKPLYWCFRHNYTAGPTDAGRCLAILQLV